MNRYLEVGDVVRGNEMFTYVGYSSKDQPETVGVSHASRNHNNGRGEWVVVETDFTGGSDGHDPYPDGHHVVLQRLRSDGTYSEKAKRIQFYQSGCFNCLIHPDKLTLVEKRRRVVDFV